MVIFIILLVSFEYKKKPGKFIFFEYLILYSIVRFFDEFLRGDSYRGFIGILSTSQFISLLILIVVTIYLLIKHFLHKKKLHLLWK
jgi:phosphatidylglycerol:prolipoprotein diacylglycerol transferase